MKTFIFLKQSIGVLIKGVLKICIKFSGEHPCQNVTSIKLLCNFIEITLRHECSPVCLLHILRTCFPTNTFGGLLPSLRSNLPDILLENVFWIISLNSKACNFIKGGLLQSSYSAIADLISAYLHSYLVYKTDAIICTLLIVRKRKHTRMGS